MPCRVLHRWQAKACCFNDDMQGTAAVALAAILAGLRSTGQQLDQQKLLFLGAGEAGTGRQVGGTGQNRDWWGVGGVRAGGWGGEVKGGR
jgi:hypothetical protein